jgi:hypothetical protein
MKKRLVLSGTAFTINLDTNFCGCWGISDQVIAKLGDCSLSLSRVQGSHTPALQAVRSGDRFIFVYNTASRASFEEFKFTRERLMTTLLDRELRKGMTDQLHMGWYDTSSPREHAGLHPSS